MASQNQGIIQRQYECDACEALYERRYEAEDCCQPSVNEVYQCPLCENTHFSEKKAITCCDYDPNAPVEPIKLTAAELELHGQLRLGGEFA